MNLALDIGNTRTKIGLFKNSKCIKTFVEEDFTTIKLKTVLNNNTITNSIIASTKKPNKTLEKLLEQNTNFVAFNNTIQLPFKNNYQTPTTLGKDRLALIAAAVAMYPKENVLVIGCGTCITFNFKSNKEVFLGGSIHPGLKMRAKAMHQFTANLPLVDLKWNKNSIAKNTIAALENGVLYGAIAEIDGIIAQYQEIYKDLTILITGGDSKILVSKLKNKIFAHSNLTLIGLNKILEHNV
ncbi:MAG: type III pantothenate kinase [Chitinophagales bacterium]|nr:type III pantothenate kinase [Chitinophagales bacterium]